jgi:hypothetical protein
VCPVGDTSQRFCAVNLAIFPSSGGGLGSIVSVPVVEHGDRVRSTAVHLEPRDRPWSLIGRKRQTPNPSLNERAFKPARTDGEVGPS